MLFGSLCATVVAHSMGACRLVVAYRFVSSLLEALRAYLIVPWWNGSSTWTVASSLESNGFFGSLDFRSSVESD